MNMLDIPLRDEPNLKIFKTRLEKWVKCNIAIKPSTKYPDLGRREPQQRPEVPLQVPQQLPEVPPQAPAAAVPHRNLITNYFQQLRR